MVALAIGGVVAKDRAVSRYVAEHVNRGGNDCSTTWHLLESHSNRVTDYWFSLPWVGCERAPLATALSSGVLVASAIVAFVAVATRRAPKFHRRLIGVTQVTVGAIALLCLIDVFGRYENILQEGGTFGDSLPLLKLEGFAFLLTYIVLAAFSMAFSELPLQRLLWLPPLLGGLSAVRYLAEDSTREAFYWPSTTLPQLEHLAQDRWYLGAAGLSLALAQMPTLPLRLKWRNVMLAVPVVILASGALVVAERAMNEAWSVRCLSWQAPHLLDACGPP
ncbi:MAG: hypothetical protein QM784_01910 [Polyangiaceae bacterium]